MTQLLAKVFGELQSINDTGRHFSPNIIFLLIIWEFHTLQPDCMHSQASQVHPLPVTHTSPKEENKRENIPSPVCVIHIITGAWSYVLQLAQASEATEGGS